MIIDPAATPAREFYKYMISVITPRPIAWVSTLSPRGITNLAPYSFFNGVGANPPSIVFCPVNRRDGSKKDTLVNIEATKEFVVNVVPYALAGPMNDSSAEVPYEDSEFTLTGLTPSPSMKIKAPRVKEAPVHMECVLHQVVSVGEGALGANIVIGRIVWMDVADEILNAQKEVDPAKLDTIGRMGGMLYSRTTERFELPRPPAK
jgi:flavin reductase (DIM6/NTAB) family NADH-FMN oxidoreductase RutF